MDYFNLKIPKVAWHFLVKLIACPHNRRWSRLSRFRLDLTRSLSNGWLRCVLKRLKNRLLVQYCFYSQAWFFPLPVPGVTFWQPGGQAGQAGLHWDWQDLHQDRGGPQEVSRGQDICCRLHGKNSALSIVFLLEHSFISYFDSWWHFQLRIS